MPFSVRQRCGHCRNIADIPFVSAAEYEARDPQPAPRSDEFRPPMMRMQMLNDEDLIDAFAVGVCPLCQKPSLILFRSTRRALPNIKAAIGEGPRPDRHSFQPDHGGGEVDEACEMDRPSVVAGGKAAEVLEL